MLPPLPFLQLSPDSQHREHRCIKVRTRRTLQPRQVLINTLYSMQPQIPVARGVPEVCCCTPLRRSAALAAMLLAAASLFAQRQGGGRQLRNGWRAWRRQRQVVVRFRAVRIGALIQTVRVEMSTPLGGQISFKFIINYSLSRRWTRAAPTTLAEAKRNWVCPRCRVDDSRRYHTRDGHDTCPTNHSLL